MSRIQMAETMFLGTDKKGDEENPLTRYRQYWEKNQYFQTSFQQMDVKGQLINVDGTVTLIMKETDINGQEANPRYRADKLRQVYCVKVYAIDEEKQIVYVSQQTAREEQKTVVDSELEERLKEEQEPVLVKGRVIKIKVKPGTTQELGVWLDLCGVGVMGYVFIGNWAPTYTPSLRETIQYGDIVEVMATEKKSFDNGFSYYLCSRKELIEDPWNEALAEKYHEGDLVRITCKSLEKTHWFGEIAGLQSIQVFTEYPSSVHDFEITVGKEYLGKIYHMDVPNHSLKARVFQMMK